MRLLRVLARALPDLLRELIGLSGAAMIAYGCWRLHPSAGLIVGGILLIAGAWLHAKMPG